MDPAVKMSGMTVSILQYSAETKHFASNIVVTDSSGETVVMPNEILPSVPFMEEYKKWNVFGGLSHPEFRTLAEVQEFNKKGVELSSKLQKELQGEAHVKPFLPILTNVTVGGKACGWWHLKDENYGFPINLQKIPITDDLKSDFRGWFIKVERWSWLDQRTVRDQLNNEASVLQVRLHHELNPKVQDMTPPTTVAI